MATLDVSAQVHAYFEAWNRHDQDELKKTLSQHVKLTDWETSASGINSVLHANAAIWSALPHIRINVVNIAISQDSRTATCEINVELNDGSSTILKVVDLLEFDSESKIIEVRAYKQ